MISAGISLLIILSKIVSFIILFTYVMIAITPL
jgi:hypothetical protein